MVDFKEYENERTPGSGTVQFPFSIRQNSRVHYSVGRHVSASKLGVERLSPRWLRNFSAGMAPSGSGKLRVGCAKPTRNGSGLGPKNPAGTPTALPTELISSDTLCVSGFDVRNMGRRFYID